MLFEIATTGISVSQPNVTSSGPTVTIVFASDISGASGGFSIVWDTVSVPRCSGTTNVFTDNSGTIADGSGQYNYVNGQSCRWVIKPTALGVVQLTILEYNLGAGDTLSVLDENGIRVQQWTSNSTVPDNPVFTSNWTTVTLVFTSDQSGVGNGFNVSYVGIAVSRCRFEKFSPFFYLFFTFDVFISG